MERTEEIKMIVKQYVDKNGESWVRIRFMDQYRTEVIIPETEFENRYGKVEDYIV